MIITKDYKILKKNDLYYVISNEKQDCPFCKGQLFLIGSRKRKLILSDSTQICLVIKRYRCKECKKIHHELPICLIPYKRYETKVIEDVIIKHMEQGETTKTELETYPCEKSTAKHIILWYQGIIFWLKISLEKNRIKIKCFFIKVLSQKSFSKKWLGYLLYDLIKINGKMQFIHSYFTI